jgi:hypothetical protein
LNIYLAGPMTGIPHFNYPAFNKAAEELRWAGHTVFNPAEHDIKTFGKDISNPTGDADQATKEHGFDRRKALKADLSWICDEADAIALLPGWERSSGAYAERSLAVALNLAVIELGDVNLPTPKEQER